MVNELNLILLSEEIYLASPWHISFFTFPGQLSVILKCGDNSALSTFEKPNLQIQ